MTEQTVVEPTAVVIEHKEEENVVKTEENKEAQVEEAPEPPKETKIVPEQKKEFDDEEDEFIKSLRPEIPPEEEGENLKAHEPFYKMWEEFLKQNGVFSEENLEKVKKICRFAKNESLESQRKKNSIAMGAIFGPIVIEKEKEAQKALADKKEEEKGKEFIYEQLKIFRDNTASRINLKDYQLNLENVFRIISRTFKNNAYKPYYLIESVEWSKSEESDDVEVGKFHGVLDIDMTSVSRYEKFHPRLKLFDVYSGDVIKEAEGNPKKQRQLRRWRNVISLASSSEMLCSLVYIAVYGSCKRMMEDGAKKEEEAKMKAIQEPPEEGEEGKEKETSPAPEPAVPEKKEVISVFDGTFSRFTFMDEHVKSLRIVYGDFVGPFSNKQLAVSEPYQDEKTGKWMVFKMNKNIIETREAAPKGKFSKKKEHALEEKEGEENTVEQWTARNEQPPSHMWIEVTTHSGKVYIVDMSALKFGLPNFYAKKPETAAAGAGAQSSSSSSSATTTTTAAAVVENTLVDLDDFYDGCYVFIEEKTNPESKYAKWFVENPKRQYVNFTFGEYDTYYAYDIKKSGKVPDFEERLKKHYSSGKMLLSEFTRANKEFENIREALGHKLFEDNGSECISKMTKCKQCGLSLRKMLSCPKCSQSTYCCQECMERDLPRHETVCSQKPKE